MSTSRRGRIASVLFLILAACSSSGGGGSSSDAGSDGSTARVCAPGQSIACVGAGGCSGGQACLSDGSGYDTCVCASGIDGGTDGAMPGSEGGSDGGTDSTAPGVDGSTNAEGGNDGATNDGGPCTTYTSSSIAAMRSAGTSGCFQLADVASIALAPNSKSPRLFVQDAAGGAYSAMMMTCSSTSVVHPCAVTSTVGAIVDGRSVTVTGSYVPASSMQVEQFLLDSISDNGAVAMPGAAVATLAQIERGSTANDLAFQHVTTTVSSNDTLVMYDWTPAEFVRVGAVSCPYQEGGFGMIPKSIGGVTAGAACTNGTSQPSGQTTPSAAEVLIGADFYTGFTLSSDCRCAKNYSAVEPSATSTLGGTIDGILVPSIAGGASFFYLAPKTNAAAPVTSTVPGM